MSRANHDAVAAELFSHIRDCWDEDECPSFNVVEPLIIKLCDLARLSASPASGGVDAVAVKALEWQDAKYRFDGLIVSARAHTILGDYRLGWDDFVVVGHAPGGCNNLPGGPWKTLDAAKAAAQADYEQRIHSALSPAATPVSEAGGEAAELRAIVHAVGEARDAAGYLGSAADCIRQLSADAEAWHRVCETIATVLGLPPPEADFANIVRDWSERHTAQLAEIEAMLSDGQGDDDGPQILPDFEPGWSTVAKVEACLHLLEKRRDALMERDEP